MPSESRYQVPGFRFAAGAAGGGRGFTLVEVLVALAVVAIAMSAVLYGLGQGIDTSAALRDRTVALWVAQNRLAQHQLARAWPALDTTEGVTEMGGRAWHWREQVSATTEQDFRRVDIEVRAAPGGEALVRLTGFLARQAPAR